MTDGWRAPCTWIRSITCSAAGAKGSPSLPPAQAARRITDDTGSRTPQSSSRWPSNNAGVTGRANSYLLDVRLDRAAAQDGPLGRQPGRLAEPAALGAAAQARQVGVPR